MYDIITLGSSTVDVFVHPALKNVRIAAEKNHHDVCLPIGAKLLIEKMEESTGGGGTNTAVAFSRLGFKTACVGAVGDDTNAAKILSVLKKERVAFLGKRKRGMSGYSVILVNPSKDRVILAYKGANNLFREQDIPKGIIKTKWLYLSSMTGKSFGALKKAAMIAKKHNIPYAFNPSHYIASMGMKKLALILGGCTLLVLNKEEAEALVGKTLPVKSLLAALCAKTDNVVITDGEKGAYATNGRDYCFIKPRKIRVVETTGAGDAFASGVVAGMMKNLSVEKSLALGMAEAESVLQKVGAKNDLLSKKDIKGALRIPYRITRMR